MKKSNLDKEIFVTLVSTIVFILVVVILAVYLVNVIFRGVNNIIMVGDFIVDYNHDQVIEEKFLKFNELKQSELNNYEITVTNNSGESDNYFIYIKPLDGVDINDLIVSLDEFIVDKISIYPYDDDGKILIYKGSVDPGYSVIHSLKFWWDVDADGEDIYKTVKFEYGIVES